MKSWTPNPPCGWLKAALSALALPALTLVFLATSCAHLEISEYPGIQPVRGRPAWILDSLLCGTVDPKEYPMGNQVVVWKNPNATTTSFNGWLAALKAQRPTVQALASCASCENSLFLLYDVGLPSYLQSQTVGTSGGSNSGGPSGGNGPALFCANFPMAIKDSIPTQADSSYLVAWSSTLPVDPKWPTTQTTGGITVAVFDSGLEPGGSGVVVTAGQSCLLTPGASSLNGWNFSYNSPNVNDDISDQHGSNVTRLIMDEARLYNATNVNILPVKVFDSVGKGDFFRILCAISYAAHAGAKIINGSFGFYHYKDPVNAIKAENLMHPYLDYYLNTYGMLFVAAAGNDDPVEDNIFSHSPGHSAKDERNIEANPFYPAHFANTDTNVIAVTTVSISQLQVSPEENYSPRTVDVGVNCDTVVPNTNVFAFYDPLQTAVVNGTIKTITGSSFATPVFTGRIAALYGQLLSQTNKYVFISQMDGIPIGGPVALLPVYPFPQFIFNGQLVIKR